MTEFSLYNQDNIPSKEEKSIIAQFLYEELEQYGDPIQDIEKAMDYSFSRENNSGGFTITEKLDGKVIGAVVINRTGMEGYIPENILVYIATHREHRGKGIGKGLMEKAIEEAEGDIALHVEPDNPAKNLYERLGFTNKYLEMRLKRERL